MLQPMLLAALRECLSAVGMKVTAAGPDQWSITVGSALMRFHDGMVRPENPSKLVLGGSCDVMHALVCMRYEKPGKS